MRSHRALSLVTSTLVLLLSLGASTSAAQTSDWVAVKGMDERFRLDVGGFFQKFDTTLRIDNPTTGRGTEISLEDDLGQDSDQVNFRADGYWRFGRHGRLDFAYTGWNRTAEHVIDRDITIDDTTYHAGARLDSRLKVSLGELYYGYSFWNTPKFEAGAQLGLTVLVHTTDVEGTGTISGPGGSASETYSVEDRSVTAPVPALGAYFRYTLAPKLLLSARVRGLGATIDNVKASSTQFRAALDYYPWKNVGFGAGYDYMNITVEKQADKTSELDYTFSGPMVYVSLAF
jgi:hypothetical protein